MLIREIALIFFFFFICQVIICDALLDEFESRFNRHKINKISVLYRLGKLIAIGRNTVLKLKNLISIFVNLVFRSRRKPNKGCIKIIEYVSVFVIDRTVRFIAYEKVKMSACEKLSFLVFYFIYAVIHRLIS